MKYIIHGKIDPIAGIEVESDPQKLQEIIGKWMALNPIGMYFSLTAREITIIVEAPSEDAFFEPLHAFWSFAKTYPTVSPVASVDEFPVILQRVGLA
jgi:hypothetical protein